MKNLNFKHALISSAAVYVIGILAFAGSYYVSFIQDADLQANIVLMLIMVPAAYFGAYLYYRKGHQTHGIVLGMAMFAGAIILDAVITVPLFIVPNGGNHLSFFADPGFWIIGLEYVTVVVVFWRLRVAKRPANQTGF